MKVHRSVLLGLVAGLLLATMWTIWPDLGGLERLAGDQVTRAVASRMRPSDEIVLVAIDDTSLRNLEPEFGRWPFSREVMARIIEESSVGGARVVAFDILFAGENQNAPAGDARFATAMQQMPVVLAAQTSPDAQSLPDSMWLRRGPAPDATYGISRGPWGGFTPSAGVGTIRLSKDARTYVLSDPARSDAAIPSLALAAVAASRAWDRSLTIDDSSVRVGPLSIPVGPEGALTLRWKDAGSEGADGQRALPYTVINLDRVVLASFAREDESLGVPAADLEAFSRQFRDKVVLVGFTAAGLINDLRATPLSPSTPGVEIHATAIDNLLSGDFNAPVPASAGFFLILAAGALTGGILSRIDSQLYSAITVLLLAVAAVGAAWLALTRGVVIPLAAPLLAILAAWGTVTVLDYLEERRRSVMLRATFGRYVSPQILEYLLENPDKVELGGTRRDMTILFSDIRGFTTISETSEPEDVVEMLNEYLTSMVEILLRHEGTLDKFIGDAVMGFWNAPTDVENHATKGVLCAVEMIEETTRLREKWEKEGKPAIRIGIGLNTGEAVVGNIGSERVFGYTVIGDTVNLAARLESTTKNYGADIIISESTLERLDKRFDIVYLDEVKVKGKDKAVRIFQVRGLS